MTEQTLSSLIANQGFDTYKDALMARCATEGIDFHSEYTADAFTIWMNYGNIPTTVKINTDGLLAFNYFKGGRKIQEQFLNCTSADFEMMNEKAFMYLRSGEIDNHLEWYNKLEKPTV
jgi:hypothetical protein